VIDAAQECTPRVPGRKVIGPRREVRCQSAKNIYNNGQYQPSFKAISRLKNERPTGEQYHNETGNMNDQIDQAVRRGLAWIGRYCHQEPHKGLLRFKGEED
jgi:hypothetical protein